MADVSQCVSGESVVSTESPRGVGLAHAADLSTGELSTAACDTPFLGSNSRMRLTSQEVPTCPPIRRSTRNRYATKHGIHSYG